MATNQSTSKTRVISSESIPGFRAWLVVGLLCVVGCLNYLDRIMITTMRSSIIEAIPMNDKQFGLLTSVFLWIYGLLSPGAGFLADRFGRSRVIIVSLFIWSLVTWLTSHATTYNELLATRALMGISEACYIPAALALIADYHKGATRSLATGIHMAGVMIGQSLGFLGGMIAEDHSWSYAFNLFGVIGVVYAVILALVLKDNKVTTSEPAALDPAVPVEKVGFAEAIKSLFSRAAFLKALAFWGLLGVAGWMISGWLPTYYKEQFNLSQSDAGFYATSWIYPFSLVGVLLGGFIADFFSRKNPRGRILVPALGLIVAAPGVLLASTTGVLWIAIAGFIVYALTRAFSDSNMMPILCMVADKRYRATGYGVLNMFSCIVGGLGIFAAGALRDSNINLTYLFQFGAATLLICGVLLLTLKPKEEE